VPDSNPQTSGLSEMIAATMTGAAQGGARLGRAVADAMTSATGRPTPTELNVPVMHRAQVDRETVQVWAVVRVDLGGGTLTELDVKKYLPATTGDLQARYVRRETGVQELRVVDGGGVLYGLTVAAPLPDLDDEVTGRG
jgi:hypothetical protein